ncbi:MAG: sulfurtransferase TusA family protein [Actinomycetota bacterium]|nr:sulfurtransferase TusA family protein [Actinomycetota bacterium]MDA8175249.1 sulfurtransferase TusA family protein [Nitrospiraceae bacterium]
MRFVDGIRPDVTADIVYMMCPMHLLKLEDMMKGLQPGQVLEILTDYDGALEDVPEWCDKTGNEFLGMSESPDFYKLYVRKANGCKPCCPLNTGPKGAGARGTCPKDRARGNKA